MQTIETGSAVWEDLARGPRPWRDVQARRPRVLVISPDAAQRSFLHRLCAASGCQPAEARDWRESVFVMARGGAEVILCDDRLPDGNWKDVLSVIATLTEPPRVIVVFDDASAAEWSEVLHLGGFDVLNRPLRDREVRLSVDAAWRSFLDTRAAAHLR